MEDQCMFDDLCEAARRNITTARTFASLENESLVEMCCRSAFKKLQEADRYCEVDLEGVQLMFMDVRDSCRAKDWQAVRDQLAVVQGFVEAAAQAHRQSHQRQGSAKTLSELQNILQLTSWEPPKGFLPN